MIFAGASQIVPDSGDVVGTPGPMPGPDAVQPSPGSRHCPPSARHRRRRSSSSCSRRRTRACCAGVACQVRRVAPTFLELALRTFTLSSLRVGPEVRIGGVQVAVPVRHVLIGADRPHVAEEPDAVAQDRAAEREVGVPVPDQRRPGRRTRSSRSSSSMLLPCAHSPARLREVEAAERVAAGLRNHVERRPAAVHFGQAAGDRDLHFGGVGHVVLIARHAAAADRGADVHAVDLDVAFAAAAAARR